VEKLFKLNPSLCLEVGRIFAGLTDCIVVNHLTKDEYNTIKDMGLDVIVFQAKVNWVVSSQEPLPSNHLLFYVFIKNCKKDVMKTLKEIERLEKNPTLENRLRINELEGILLGYPECCVKEFIHLKMASSLGEAPPPETKTVLECIKSDLFVDVLKNFPEPEFPEIAYSLFTSNFYPCKIGCIKAKRVGKDYENYLDKYSLAYRCKIVSNVVNLLVPVFEVYRVSPNPKTEFGKAVVEFVENLGNLRDKAEKIVDLYKLNPIKFENDYIAYRYAQSNI